MDGCRIPQFGGGVAKEGVVRVSVSKAAACLVFGVVVGAGCQLTSPLGLKGPATQSGIETALRANSPPDWEWIHFHKGERTVHRAEELLPGHCPEGHLVVSDGGLIRQAGSNIDVIYRAVVTPAGKLKQLRILHTGEEWRVIDIPQ